MMSLCCLLARMPDLNQLAGARSGILSPCAIMESTKGVCHTYNGDLPNWSLLGVADAFSDFCRIVDGRPHVIANADNPGKLVCRGEE